MSASQSVEHNRILELFKLPDARRDEHWEKEALALLPHCRATILQDIPEPGPDRMPYLLVEIKETSDEPMSQILNWLSDKGIGLVVNPQNNFPDAILTYGMIWNFREHGVFVTPAKIMAEKEIVLEAGSSVHAGAPAKEYLPDYARAILKKFFLDQAILLPEVLVMSQDKVNYDLCFALESIGTPPEPEREGILETVSWFLPPHYSLAIVSKKGLPPFYPL